MTYFYRNQIDFERLKKVTLLLRLKIVSNGDVVWIYDPEKNNSARKTLDTI